MDQINLALWMWSLSNRTNTYIYHPIKQSNNIIIYNNLILKLLQEARLKGDKYNV